MTNVLYYMPGTCALSELICLEWIGEPYELCRVSRDQKSSPAYLALNPNGTVPTMKLGGEVVYGNNALLGYLADSNPSLELAPKPGSVERARFDQWLSYLDSGYHLVHYPIFKTSWFSDDESHHPALVEKSKERVAEQLERMNAHLTGKDHFFGSARTALDAYAVAVLRWGRNWFDYSERFPEVDRYLNGLHNDPAVVTAKQIEADENLGARGNCTRHVPLEA